MSQIRKSNRIQKPVHQMIKALARDQQHYPYKVGIAVEPPQRQANPVVERTVRIFLTVPGVVNISNNVISAQDAVDYLGSSINLRYRQTTIVGIKVWQGDDGTLPLMTVTHVPTGFQSVDAGTSGAKRASIALRIPPPSQFNALANDATPIFAVINGGTGTGVGYADVTVRSA